MSIFYWNASGGGDFGDASNWLETMPDGNNEVPANPPGAGDDVFISTSGTITTDGQTIASLSLQGTLSGDIDVTGTIIGSLGQSILTGGSVTCSMLETCFFEGTSLTADTVFGGLLMSGQAKVGTMSTGATVAGAEVVAEKIVSEVEVRSGSLTIKGDLILDHDDSLSVSGGTATIGGLLTINSGKDGGGLSTSGGTIHLASAILAQNASATGTIYVEDTGAKLIATGTITVGDGGKSATLDVEFGGKAELDQLVVGGSGSGSYAVTVSQQHSVLMVTGSTIVGEDGAGTLSVEAGASFKGGSLIVGNDASGQESVTPDGHKAQPGDQVVVYQADLTVQQVELGVGGSAAMQLTKAHVSVTGDFDLASDAGSDAQLKMKKGMLSVGGDWDVAVGGKAAMSFSKAHVQADGALTAGSDTSSNARLHIAGGDFGVTGDVVLADQGSAQLILAKAATVEIGGDLTLAMSAHSAGTLHVGGGSLIDVAGDLTVGDGGKGTLTIGGGTVAVEGSDVEIGSVHGANGTVTVTGAGSMFQGATLAVGGTADAHGGMGSLAVAGSGMAMFDSGFIWDTGKVVLDGGGLSIGDLHGNGAITIERGGELDLTGSDADVAIAFSGSGEKLLALSSADLLHASITGFAANDVIKVSGLDAKATITTAIDGKITMVTFLDDHQTMGHISLQGRFSQADLAFDASTGKLTLASGASVLEWEPHLTQIHLGSEGHFA